MRCVVSTPFGRPVEPEVNPILATVSGPSAARALVDRRASARSARRSPMPLGLRSTTSGRTTRRARARTRRASSANTSPGVHRVDDLAHPRVVAAQQRVRRAQRHDRHAGGERAEHEHQVLERVARQDDERSVEPEAAVEQGLGDRVGLLPRLAPGQRGPAAAVPARSRARAPDGPRRRRGRGAPCSARTGARSSPCSTTVPSSRASAPMCGGAKTGRPPLVMGRSCHRRWSAMNAAAALAVRSRWFV